MIVIKSENDVAEAINQAQKQKYNNYATAQDLWALQAEIEALKMSGFTVLKSSMNHPI